MTLYTPIPTTAIHNESLNEQQFHTYCLIMEKCWNPDAGAFEWTSPYSMSMLSKELGKPRTTLMRHINHLVDENVLQRHDYSDVAFALIPTATVHERTGVSTGGPITINTDSLLEGTTLSELKEKNVHEWTPVHQPTVAVEIVEILKNVGVGDPMRWKIATSGVSVEYVKGWLNWMVDTGAPLNHLVASLRDELPLPEYCQVCRSWNGTHKGVVDEDRVYQMCPREDRPELTAVDVFNMFGEMSPA